MNRNLVNAVLHAVDNLSAILFGLVGTALLARAFGPENLSRLGVVQAGSALLMFLATLGFENFMMRDIARNRHDGELLGTVQIALLFGWIAHSALLALLMLAQGRLTEDWMLVSAVALSTLFSRVVFTSFYLRATNQTVAIAASAIVSRLLALGFLVAGRHLHLGYDVMVAYLVVQSLVQCAWLTAGFLKTFPRQVRFGFSAKRLARALREAMPVIAASAVFPIFMQADVLVLAHFLNPHDVGIYAAAARLIPQALFLGYVSAATFFPAIVALHDSADAGYEAFVGTVARTIVLGALVAAITCSLGAGAIVRLLYGQAFAASAEVLAILVWTWVFMLPAALYSRLLILHGLARFELLKSAVTAAASLALNIFLIPRFGVLAAAWVSVLSYLLADLLLYAVFGQTRFIFRMATKALLAWFVEPAASLRASVLLFSHRP